MKNFADRRTQHTEPGVLRASGSYHTEGKHTGAVYGFLNILFRILEEENRIISQWLSIFMNPRSAIRYMKRTREPVKACRRNLGNRFRL